MTAGPQPVRIFERRHRLRPYRLAAHVEREQPGVAEIDVDALAVGDRRFRCVRVLLVHRLQRHGRVDHALPLILPVWKSTS